MWADSEVDWCAANMDPMIIMDERYEKFYALMKCK